MSIDKVYYCRIMGMWIGTLENKYTTLTVFSLVLPLHYTTKRKLYTSILQN